MHVSYYGRDSAVAINWVKPFKLLDAGFPPKNGSILFFKLRIWFSPKAPISFDLIVENRVDAYEINVLKLFLNKSLYVQMYIIWWIQKT